MSTTDKDKTTNIDNKIEDLSLNINWDNIINYRCSHLLPCGVCEITNKRCPLHGWNEPQWGGDPCWTTGVPIKQKTTVGICDIEIPEPWRVDGIATTTTPERECVYTDKEEKKND